MDVTGSISDYLDDDSIQQIESISDYLDDDSIQQIESISDYLDDDSIQQIESVYADKGYDAKYIRMYLWDRNIACCIPYKINSKFILQNNDYKHYNKTRFVVERFFAWLKNGFHRTRIRYERTAENYLAFVNLASF